MFTGLVEELGRIKSIVRSSRSVRLTVQADKVLQDVKMGDSIAVNGTCLTVVEFTPHSFSADVMPETVDRTVLAALRTGDKVNLERCLRVGDRLGGHIVSGHVDGVGTIYRKESNDIAIIVSIKADASLLRYVVSKGSIAVDGASLTVVNVTADSLSVSLIPHTADLTTLGHKKEGEPVNLEVDIIGKYVERLLTHPLPKQTSSSKLTDEFLRNNGFM